MIRTTITIATAPKKYDVIIADSVLNRLEDALQFTGYTKVAVLTDTTLQEKILPIFSPQLPQPSRIITIAPGEQSKSIETAMSIWRQMMEFGMDRKSLLINLGGGVITDLGGFVASTYMRGIPFIQIPTTLLAQVDASVGGKTGINFAGVKNTIGTFQQPIKVIIDVSTLKALPDREFVSGFAEILKHGLIKDIEYFRFSSIKKPRELSSQELMNIIEKSVKIKADIVAGDVEETGGARKLLNFGHTIGHAIEAALLDLNTPILHGEAISLGMVAEAKLAELKGLLKPAETIEIRDTLAKMGLPISLQTISAVTITQKMKFDKKNESGVVKFTLLKAMGDGIADVEANDDLVQQALQFITG